MKTAALLALATLSLCACTANRAMPIAAAGYVPEGPAVAAMERGDWARAERLLLDTSRVDAEDPARLINLGKVYWETGRRDLARASWRRALASTSPLDVETTGGRRLSTTQLAREALTAADSGPLVTASSDRR